MKIMNIILSENDKPLYLKIADAVRQLIVDGNLCPGDRLMSTRQLAAQLDVNRNTVINALAELVAEGWIIASERSAYRVNEVLPDGFFRTAQEHQFKKFAVKTDWDLGREGDLMAGFFNTPASRVLLDSSSPDLRHFPINEFKSCMVEALTFSPQKILGYARGQSQGHPPLISALETYLRRYRSISDHELIVTQGSQEALFLCAQTFLGPGRSAAVPELSYPPAWEAFRASGARLTGIKSDSAGVDPDSLASIVKKQNIHMIYLTPLHQFPISKKLSQNRRNHIYAIAARHGIPIVEDDYDHEFHYETSTPIPMASRDSAQIVIYISTFSKILCPGIRIGFMAVPSVLLEPLAGFRRIMNLQQTTLTQDAVARWMQRPGFEKHLYAMRQLYQERRDYMIQGLNTIKATRPGLDFHPPEGGMAIWLDTGENSANLAKRALKQGIAIQQERIFHLYNQPGPHIRLGFSAYSKKEIKQGLGQLRALWPAS